MVVVDAEHGLLHLLEGVEAQQSGVEEHAHQHQVCEPDDERRVRSDGVQSRGHRTRALRRHGDRASAGSDPDGQPTRLRAA